MTAGEAARLKPGDVILVRMRVTKAFPAGTMGHARGWVSVENITDAGLLGYDVVVSGSDVVTPADLKAWKGTP